MKEFAIIYCALFSLMQTASAQTWTRADVPTNSWVAVASSADGRNLVAAAFSGGIYTSTNFGATWISNSVPSLPWNSVASSADGTKLVAIPLFTTTLYTSTNSGATWNTNAAGANDWHWVASSADGNRLLGAGNNGRLAISTNAGVGWTIITNAPGACWGCVASSADGSKLIAGDSGSCNTGRGPIYTSANFGATWATNNALQQSWTSVCSSADGTRLAAVWGGASIFTSADSGNTWSSTNFSGQHFYHIAASANALTLVAPSGGTLYTSSDSGVSWSSNSLPEVSAWGEVALSADGNRLVAKANGSQIWLAQTTPQPQVHFALSSANLALSWIIPSTNFVMRQSADLTSWTDVTNAPALNLSNLQNEVQLILSSGNAFFRLASP